MRLKCFTSLVILAISKTALAQEIQLPLTFIKDINIPEVVLKINGKPEKFILDTGSQTALHLPLNTLKQLPETIQIPTTNKSLDLSGKIKESDQFLIKHLNINGLEFQNIEAMELKPWGWNYSSNPEQKKPPVPDESIPVVGLTLFQEHILTLDIAHRKIIIDDRNNPNRLSHQWTVFPYKIHPKEGMVIKFTDLKKTYNLILDTGASMSFLKGTSRSEKLSNSKKITTDNTEKTTLRLNKRGYPITVKIYPDNPTIRKIPVRAAIMDGMPAEFESDGLLGIDFLQKYSVRIDQKNHQLWIKPAF